MKRLLFGLILCCVTVSLCFADGPLGDLPFLYEAPDAITLIDQAERTGELHPTTALVKRVAAIFAPESLSTQFQSPTIIRCGMPTLRDIALQWHEMPQELKNEINTLWPVAALYDTTPIMIADATNGNWYSTITNRYPDLDQTYNSRKKNPNFIIHYTTKGSNAVSGIKYVKQTAQILEKSHKWINRVYGKTPKNAGPLRVVLITMNAWGYCAPLGYQAGDQTVDAYIALRNNIDSATHADYRNYGKAMMRGVGPHEYFHAVQFNFDVHESTFMMESSSTWIEGVIYPMNKTYIIDGLALPYYYLRPFWPLWYTGNDFHYATMAFQRFLHEHFRDNTVNAELWEQCATVRGNNSMAAVNTVLGARDTDLRTVLKEFGAQNFFNRYWDYNKNKNIWPTLSVHASHETYGVEPVAGHPNLYHTGTSYVELKPPTNLQLKKGAELLVKLKRNAGQAVGYVLLEKNARNFEIVDIPTDATDAQGYYEVMVDGFGKRFKRAVLMVQVPAGTANTTPHTYTYAAACPQVEIKSFEPTPATIYPGQSSRLTLKFDAEGVWNTMDYPLRYKAHIRAPSKVTDGVTDLETPTRNGEDLTRDLFFNTGFDAKPGRYRFGIQFVFGTTKQRTSMTNIEWCEVVVEERPDPDGVYATPDDNDAPKAWLSFGAPTYL